MSPALISTSSQRQALICFYLQDKSLPDVLLTLCSWLQLSAAPPLSVAADDNRHFNISCNALITYLFFTWDGIYDSSEQYTVIGTQNTDKFSNLLDHYRGIKMSFGYTYLFNSLRGIVCFLWQYKLVARTKKMHLPLSPVKLVSGGYFKTNSVKWIHHTSYLYLLKVWIFSP